MQHIWLLVTFAFTCPSSCNGSPFLMLQNAPAPEKIKSDTLISFESDTHEGKSIKDSRSGVALRERTLPLFLVRFLSVFELKRVVRELETSSMSSVSCVMCKYGIGMLKYFLASGATEDEIARKAETFCTELHIESERVCHGIVNSFKHDIFYIFAKSNLSLYEICSGIVGGSCGQTSQELNWTIALPPVPKPSVKNVPLPKPGSPVLKVLHLSDTHFDMYYKEGADAECGEPLCCRISDNLVNGSRRAGKWGDYRKCDTPLRTIESMFDFIAKNFKLDYILWTGDIPPHDIWDQSRADQIYVLKQTTKLFMKYFPNIPIFPALGNHESAPVNSFPPPYIKGNDSISWLYDELINVWSNWLPNYTLPTIKKWLLLNSTDPAEELQWLVYELQYAELKHEKVHIIGHIPPGTDDCMKVWSANFYKIINRQVKINGPFIVYFKFLFESTVTAQFYGHTHVDEFEIFYDEKVVTRPSSIAYIGPSVTPYVGLNPAFRIYTVDGFHPTSNYAVLDHDNYMMDLKKANQNGEPDWIKLYSAKEAYNMQALQPTNWDKLVKQMVTDNKIFQRYYEYFIEFQNLFLIPRYYHRASPVFQSCEDKKCKLQILCAIISGKSHDPTQCLYLRKSLFKI
uniref:Sphingomyelin phosphodiesterase n=1 Tax=Strigamia maritima TaxID=126957 RepID=T1IQF8_STRMM